MKIAFFDTKPYDERFFREILDGATVGLLALLVEWLFGVHMLSPDPTI